MSLAAILPHLAGLRVARIELCSDDLVLEVATRARSARCPACGRRSRRVHGYYTRKIADQPIGDRRVTLHLRVRRLRCRRAACPRRTFAQPTPALVARYARRSAPRQTLLQDIGLALGGRPGARFAHRRAIATSRTTLLRLVRKLPEPATAAPAVLGVDDFALARGRRYGTLLVDLERRRPVDLLPDRSAESLATWRREHGQPAIVCRDRGGEYARGARQGAPDAVQVADRWHLLENAGDALERVLGRHAAALRQAVAAADGDAELPAAPATPPASPHAPVSAPRTPPPLEPAATAPRQGARAARYAAVVALHRQGRALSAISRRVGVSRPTVRRWLRAGRCPERAPHPRQLHDLAPHAAYLRARWAAGCRNAAQLWRELRARGFAGAAAAVRRYLRPWRADPGPQRLVAAAPPRTRPPAPRRVRWWLLAPAAELAPTQQAYLDRLRAACPAVAQAARLAAEFGRLVRERDRVALAPWLETAATSGLPEFRELAAGMPRDRAAIEAALTHEWSSGQVEGQVTRLKLVKRQMFGRAKVDLLRKRVLLAS